VQIAAARHAIKTDCGVGVAFASKACCEILVVIGDLASMSDSNVSCEMLGILFPKEMSCRLFK